jgi:hypothetical protein
VDLSDVLDQQFKFQGMFDRNCVNIIFIVYVKVERLQRIMAVCIGYLYSPCAVLNFFM